MLKTCKFINLGMLPYGQAWALQQKLVAARKAGKAPDVLLLCEHPPVITLGRNGKIEHLQVSREQLESQGVEFHHTDRGGDITYHGPGQLVGYPILNLGEIRRDVGWYVRQLEETMIRVTADFGVEAGRVPGCTGVWISPPTDRHGARPKEKLGAIGVHLSRWVTSHGFAYNVSTDLRRFELIVPCGIPGCRTTSLEKLLGRTVTIAQVTHPTITAFGNAFDLEMVAAHVDEMNDWFSFVPETAGAPSP